MSKIDTTERKARHQRRLGLALRENLKRRKAQEKGRKSLPPRAEGAEESDGKPHDSAGIVGDK